MNALYSIEPAGDDNHTVLFGLMVTYPFIQNVNSSINGMSAKSLTQVVPSAFNTAFAGQRTVTLPRETSTNIIDDGIEKTFRIKIAE